MIDVRPIQVGNATCIGIDVQLPKTNLLAIRTETGYVMCGALDVDLLRTRLVQRNILAARAVGVRNLDELLNGDVESCTQTAESIGIQAGMPIQEALQLMIRHERSQREQ